MDPNYFPQGIRYEQQQTVPNTPTQAAIEIQTCIMQIDSYCLDAWSVGPKVLFASILVFISDELRLCVGVGAKQKHKLNCLHYQFVLCLLTSPWVCVYARLRNPATVHMANFCGRFYLLLYYKSLVRLWPRGFP